MFRYVAVLLVLALWPILLAPSPAQAWHDSRAVIDDVRYVNGAGGVTFHVDFAISGHVGYVGAVRVRVSDGYDVVDVVRTFQPGYDPAFYRSFTLFVSHSRLAAEGAFLIRSLDVTVEIIDAGGNVLARSGGTMAWSPGAF